MTTAIDYIMFVVPLLTALLFTVLTVVPKGQDKPENLFSGALITFFSSLLSSISWFIFGLTWPVLASSEMLSSVAYLWYVLGVIFAIFTIYVGLRMLGSIFETKKPQLVLQMTNEGE